jgi:hypothetical protein
VESGSSTLPTVQRDQRISEGKLSVGASTGTSGTTNEQALLVPRHSKELSSELINGRLVFLAPAIFEVENTFDSMDKSPSGIHNIVMTSAP